MIKAIILWATTALILYDGSRIALKVVFCKTGTRVADMTWGPDSHGAVTVIGGILCSF
jgi:hypothetical protein